MLRSDRAKCPDHYYLPRRLEGAPHLRRWFMGVTLEVALKFIKHKTTSARSCRSDRFSVH